MAKPYVVLIAFETLMAFLAILGFTWQAIVRAVIGTFINGSFSFASIRCGKFSEMKPCGVLVSRINTIWCMEYKKLHGKIQSSHLKSSMSQLFKMISRQMFE
jgi:hypothetical protein